MDQSRQPVLKLVSKERDGAKVRKHDDLAQTPCRHVLATQELPRTARTQLEQQHAAQRPGALRQELEAAIARLGPGKTRSW